jgi:hypothetical protein
MTDAAGIATFDTLYPGWYRGRTTHIHFKVFLDEKTVLMSQIYFPDALSEFINQNVAPYNERAAGRDTFNAGDNVLLASGGGHGSFCSIKEDEDFYLASLVIGVDRTAEAAGGNATGGPGGPGAGGPPPDGPPPGGAASSGSAGSLVPGVE